MALHLGIDIDGVLADFDGHFRKTYEHWFGVPHEAEPGTWDILGKGTWFPDAPAAWAWIDRVPRFWQGVPTLPGALGAVYRLLYAEGHRISLLTTRSGAARIPTQEWLQANWPAANTLPAIQFVSSGLKGTVDCQLYVEDSPTELESLRNKPCVLIFDQPWNRDVKEGQGLHRVKGWAGVEKFIWELTHGDEIPHYTTTQKALASKVRKAGEG